MLEVACHRCERRGGVSLARLIDEHGADTGLPDLWRRSPVIVSMRARRRCIIAAGFITRRWGVVTVALRRAPGPPSSRPFALARIRAHWTAVRERSSICADLADPMTCPPGAQGAR